MAIHEQLNAGQTVIIKGTMGAVTVRYESCDGKPCSAGMIFPGNTLNNYAFGDTLEQAVCYLYQQLAAREAARAVREAYLAEMEPVVVSELDNAIMTGCISAL